jgi:hypothetical protein
MTCPGCGLKLPNYLDKCPSCGARPLAGVAGHSEPLAENTALSVTDVELATRKVAKVTGHDDLAGPGKC